MAVHQDKQRDKQMTKFKKKIKIKTWEGKDGRIFRVHDVNDDVPFLRPKKNKFYKFLVMFQKQQEIRIMNTKAFQIKSHGMSIAEERINARIADMRAQIAGLEADQTDIRVAKLELELKYLKNNK